MTPLPPAYSPRSVAAPKMACWIACFPLVAKLWRELLNELFDSYRPELHYMRGPGPRWWEKRAASSLHGGGTRASGQNLTTDLGINAPGMASSAPRPGAHAAGRPPGRPHSYRQRSCRSQESSHSNRAPDAREGVLRRDDGSRFFASD